MRIKRFNENANEKLSDNRVDDIIKDLREFEGIITSKKKVIEGLLNELDGKAENSIPSLQKIEKSLTTTSEEIDTIIVDLEKYKNDYLLDEEDDD